MKKGKVLGLFAMSAMLLTGCVDAMPELTADQSDIIAEYAAGLILKYSPVYDYKIVSEEEVAAARAAMQELPDVQETETEPVRTPEESSDTPAPEAGNKPAEETPAETESTQEGGVLSTAELDFAAELGIDDLIIRYQSFEICSAYPHNNSGFSVDAARDKKLLVMHFDLEGLPEEDVDCNLFDYNLRMRVNINGTSSASVINTLIPNYLMTYMDVVPAGEIIDVVAVAEINDMTEEEIESLVLQVSSNGHSCTARLK